LTTNQPVGRIPGVVDRKTFKGGTLLKFRSIWPRLAMAGLIGAGVAVAQTGFMGTAGASNAPVVMGVITDLSGSLIHHPDYVEGAQAAAAAINESGGINGHHIKIVSCDEQGSPNAAAECGQTMITDHAVMVTPASSFGNSYMPELRAANIPVLGPNLFSSDETTFTNAFFVGAGANAEIAGEAALCAKLGAHQIGVAILDIPETAGIIPALYRAIAPFGLHSSNLTIVKIPPTAADFSSYAASVSLGTQCVMNFIETNQAILLIKALHSIGSTEPVVAQFDGSVPPSSMQQVSSYTNLYDVFMYPPNLKSKPWSQFRNEFTALEGANNSNMDLLAGGAWASVHIAAKALASSSSLTGKNLLKGMTTAGAINVPPFPPVNYANRTYQFPPSSGVRTFSNDVVVVHYVNAAPVPYYHGEFVDYLKLKSAPPLK
jgi:ABC-type branched-subunit amino acid transport system substrate-binding protein